MLWQSGLAYAISFPSYHPAYLSSNCRKIFQCVSCSDTKPVLYVGIYMFIVYTNLLDEFKLVAIRVRTSRVALILLELPHCTTPLLGRHGGSRAASLLSVCSVAPFPLAITTP